MWDRISEWEKHHHQKHPLVSQVVSRTISALLVAGLLWFFAQAKAVFSENRIDQAAGHLTIANKGLLPLNAKYSLISNDTSVSVPTDQMHVTVYPGKMNNEKILEVTNLPWSTSAVLQVSGPGSVQVKDVSGNTVIMYPPKPENVAGGSTVILK